MEAISGVSPGNIATAQMDKRTEMQERMEEEMVDLQFIQAAVDRSRGLSQQVSTVLNSFDERLVHLEASILPIHSSTQQLTRINDNMDKAAGALQNILGYFALGATAMDDSPLGRAPESDFEAYFDAMGRLRTAFVTLSGSQMKQIDRTTGNLRSMLLKAIDKLDALLKRYASEASAPIDVAKWTPAEASATALIPPSTLLDKLSTLTNQLAAYEADSSLGSSTSFAQTIIKVRAAYLQRLFAALASATLSSPQAQASDKAVPYVTGSSPFIQYTRALMRMINHEWMLLRRILPGTSPSSSLLQTCLEAILSPALDQYAECAEAILARVKKCTGQQQDFTAIFILFDIIETFLATMPTDGDAVLAPWQEAMQYAGKRTNDLQRLVQEFASIALKAFGELIEHIKSSAGKTSSLPDDGTVHELSSNTIMFLRRLCEHAPTVEMLLEELVNRGQWTFQTDAKVDVFSHLARRRRRPSLQGSLASLDERDEDDAEKVQDQEKDSLAVLDRPAMRRYISDTVTALCGNLETKAKGYQKKPSDKTPKSILATLFLLNNFHYALKSLRSQSILLQISGPAVESMLEKKMREEFDFYLISWKHLVTPLTDRSLPNKDLSKHDREAVKDKFRAFNTDFEESHRLQARYAVPDSELRQQLVREVKNSVVPVFTEYWTRYAHSGFTTHPEKYLKFDAGAVELMLSKLFDPITQ